jgi:26S proteasome regulatory subunit N1
MADRPTAEIAVPSKDPKEKKKEEDKKLDTKANGVKDEDEELVSAHHICEISITLTCIC